MLRATLAAAVSSLALLTTAHAADIYRAESGVGGYKDGPVYVANTWTGFYAGVNGGGAFGEDPGRVTILRPNGQTATIPGAKPSGGFGGGQIGYNWQGGLGLGSNLVIGIEADIQGSDINDSIHFLPSPIGGTASRSSQVNVDYFGTVRGRIGYAFDRTLVYATGGFAYGNVNYRVRNGVNTVIYTNDNSMETGYTVGGGL
jgi:outer membrane immunogenic protein